MGVYKNHIKEYQEIRVICKEIIKSYVYYVRDEVQKGNLHETGIDEDLEVYKMVFFDVLGAALGVPSIENPMTKEEEKAAVNVIEEVIKKQRVFTKSVSLIYTMCTDIFDKVIEELEVDDKLL